MNNDVMQYLERKAFFMGSGNDLTRCEKVLVGLPMDSTTSFRPGTRHAPYRVREVSEAVEEFSVYQDKSLEEIDFYDAGDVIVPFGNILASLDRMEQAARYFLAAGKKLFSIGGEHLVSLPMVRAYKEKYPDLCVLQLDAHADLRADYLGEALSHATVMRQVLQIVGDKNLFQLGIRSGTRDEFIYGAEHSNLYIDRVLPVVDEVLEKIGRRPLYITLDIDVLDPAFAPGTGTTEAGGISSKELLQTLHRLSQANVAGFDMVEISPPYDQSDNTSILGAKVMREALLAY